MYSEERLKRYFCVSHWSSNSDANQTGDIETAIGMAHASNHLSRRLTPVAMI